MARVYVDRVMETSTTTGTKNITLAGAVAGFRTFGSKIAIGDTFDYAIIAVDGSGVPTGVWETGRGTYSALNTLTRTQLHDSSTGASINFAAGAKRVMLSYNGQSIVDLITLATPQQVTPVIRASTLAQSASTAALVVPFPAGTKKGDLVIVHCGGAYNQTVPAGWTSIVTNGVAAATISSVFWKVMTDADIAAGGITIAYTTAYECAATAVTIEGGTFDPAAPIARTNVKGASNYNNLDLATTINDLQQIVISGVYIRDYRDPDYNNGVRLQGYWTSDRSIQLFWDNTVTIGAWNVRYTPTVSFGMVGFAAVVNPAGPPDFVEEAPTDGKNYARKGADWAAIPYRVGTFFASEPAADALLLAHVVTDAFTLPAGLAGTRVSVGTNPSGTTVLSVRKNGTQVGTISISSAGVATLAAATATAFAAGDVLSIVAPAAGNGLANVALTLRGE